MLGGVVFVLAIRAIGRFSLDREEAELAQRRGEERFRALVQDSADGITIIDRYGVMSYASPGAERISGVPAADLVGDPARDHLHPDDRARFDSWVQALMLDPDGSHTTELRIPGPAGGWLWLEATGRNLMDNPAVGGIVSNFRDVTARREEQDRAAYAARHDGLTGLANRAALPSPVASRAGSAATSS